ncbi:toxin-activating lysine-acyltransferase [Pantoea sp. A4]|uniref:toxin-activating lysine-acyltransferase n=1 Tax=Pantoea sp. A4 TaxID=1225184 RepID=UPI00035C1E40|nr:toxin-activating lysine-acyltransferase [Pantoea sp. A4]
MEYIHELCDGKDEWSTHEKIGFAVSCMLKHRNYSLYPVLSIQRWTEYAINHHQIKFFFDGHNQPLGYITWAYLEADTELRMLNDEKFNLHPSEWNEGGRIWLLDFCCAPGYSLEVIKKLKRIRPWGEGQVRWISRRNQSIKVFS